MARYINSSCEPVLALIRRSEVPVTETAAAKALDLPHHAVRLACACLYGGGLIDRPEGKASGWVQR